LNKADRVEGLAELTLMTLTVRKRKKLDRDEKKAILGHCSTQQGPFSNEKRK
jgi:hypothetical protein